MFRVVQLGMFAQIIEQWTLALPNGQFFKQAPRD